MSDVLNGDVVDGGMVRGFRSLEISYKGHHEIISMPGWYKEGFEDGIHSEEDMNVSDKALTRLKDEVAASLPGVPMSEDQLLQVVEERLDVGKRSVSRGKVRVHTSVVSRDVSENVTLHGEIVSVDRRVVDRPVSASALDIDPFTERTIEMEEFIEEPVVAKSVHVVEEIGVHKEATDHVETVRETLRRTVVDIEDGRNMGGVSGALGRFAAEIHDDMEVVGSDGVHVGTVDRVDGGRIELKTAGPAAGGEHHYLAHDMVQSVAGRVMLAVTAAEAKARWVKA